MNNKKIGYIERAWARNGGAVFCPQSAFFQRGNSDIKCRGWQAQPLNPQPLFIIYSPMTTLYIKNELIPRLKLLREEQHG
jgi:hypothetical protein